MTWAALELAAKPAFFIEPPDKSPASELQRVVAFRVDLRAVMPQARVVAIPNAAKRGPQAARIAKAEGMARGFPDMAVIAPGRIAFLEWKAARAMPSIPQIEWLNWLAAYGFHVACVRSSEVAMAFLRSKGWDL